MRTDKLTLGFAYLRLSNEEAQGGESSSITNQRMIVQNYCKQNGITLVRDLWMTATPAATLTTRPFRR